MRFWRGWINGKNITLHKLYSLRQLSNSINLLWQKSPLLSCSSRHWCTWRLATPQVVSVCGVAGVFAPKKGDSHVSDFVDSLSFRSVLGLLVWPALVRGMLKKPDLSSLSTTPSLDKPDWVFCSSIVDHVPSDLLRFILNLLVCFDYNDSPEVIRRCDWKKTTVHKNESKCKKMTK